MGGIPACCVQRDEVPAQTFNGTTPRLPPEATNKNGEKRKLSRKHSVSGAVTRAKEGAKEGLLYMSVAARYHRHPARLEDDYNVDRSKILGEGGFASVCLALDKAGSAGKYAIKSMSKEDLTSTQIEELEAEVEIFLAMDHPNVVRLVDVYDEVDVIHMVMEAMEGGELLKRLEESEGRRLSEELAAHATWHMLLAVSYMHSMGIAHRDLKIENFLYEEQGYNHLKLADFGFGKRMGKGSQAVRAHDGVGTLWYLAPEVLEGDYDEKCDMWSFGVIVYVMLTGAFPFKGKDSDETMDLIHEGKFSMDGDVWANISDDAKDLVRKLLLVEPEERLSAAVALKHPWIQTAVAVGREQVHDDVVKALVAFTTASKFKRACLTVMALVLPSSERDKVRRQFIGIDSDNSGQIGREEIEAAMAGRCDDETAQKVFGALDTSHGGQVTYTEFLAATIAREDWSQELVESAFRKLDRDKTDYITEGNFEEVLGNTYDGGLLTDLFAEAGIDKDGDGQVSREEFFDFLKGTAQRA